MLRWVMGLLILKRWLMGLEGVEGAYKGPKEFKKA